MKTSAALVKLVIFMIVTSILTLFLAATIGNITFGGKTTYKAMFSDVTGLLAGNDVRLAGVRIGQVTGIALADRKLAKVTFTLDQKRQIPESAILRLRYRNLVGERYLAVTEGPGSATMLKPGSTVPLTQTRNALDLTVLFNGFRPLFQALDPQSTNEVAYELIQTLQGEGGTFEALMQRTASLTNSLADRDAVIGRVINNLSTVLDTLDNGNQLSELVLQLRRLAGGFAQDRVAIGQSIVGINDLTSATTSLLTDIRGPLRTDIAQLGAVAGTLDANKATVNGVLQRLPNKLNRIIGTATYGSWFNFYLCGFDGRIVLPTGAVMSPHFVNDAARCKRGAGE
ncbi:MAG: phospholipid/cholesterol/gamma-HCH transport system substrate-binding protein [Actinomycetota bacterium]|jgi:phospholipid/cholesterol/gamma-HCH transport system substrate-binding protein|nr:phospholipid/cholesterol/gamma-HCH transport system substrate-binding protein [Actinomycetota bacterium]